MSLWDSAIAAKPTVSTRSSSSHNSRLVAKGNYEVLNDDKGLDASLLASEQEMVSPQVRFEIGLR
jgi:hypothetical protein